MKNIIIVEKLNLFLLVLSIFLKIFNKNIYYRNISKILRRSFVDDLLTKFGIKNIGFNDINIKYIHEGYAIKKNLELKFIEKKVEKNFLFLSFLKKYNINVDKFKICLRKQLGGFGFAGESISLIEKNFSLKNNKIHYITDTSLSYLLLLNFNKNLKVYSFVVLFKLILLSFKKFFNIFKKNIFRIIRKFIKQNKKIKYNLDNLSLDNFEIAFFPHKSLKYGKAYNKTYIYSKNKEDKLYKSKVLTILKEPVDKFSKRYFKLYNIPNIATDDLIKKLKLSELSYLFKDSNLINFIKNFSISNFLVSFFIFKNILEIEKNITLFEKLNKLKIIYCDYDVLFPSTILIACEIKKIKTISHQERYSLNTTPVFPPLFYNYYLCAGISFQKEFENHGYIVDKYFNIGTLRTSRHINKKKLEIKSEFQRLRNIKSKKVLCVGTYILNKYETREEGEDGTSIKNNNEFFNQIIILAKKFPDLYFIIRLKDDSTTYLLQKNILDEIEQINNIELSKNSSKINIYEIVRLSSFVIGRATSLVEESLNDEIPAIIYDEVNVMRCYSNYHLNKTIITAKNNEELCKYLKVYLNNESLYNDNLKNELDKSFAKHLIHLEAKTKVQNVLRDLL